MQQCLPEPCKLPRSKSSSDAAARFLAWTDVMVKILREKCELFAKCFSNRRWSVFEGGEDPVRKVDFHRPVGFAFFRAARLRKLRLMAAIASEGVSNGP